MDWCRVKGILSHYFNTSLLQVGRVRWNQVVSCLQLIPEFEFKRNAQTAHLTLTVNRALGGEANFEDILMPFANPKSKGGEPCPYILEGDELADFRLALRLGVVSQWVLNRMMKGPGD